jgi:hypothetical protein
MTLVKKTALAFAALSVLMALAAAPVRFDGVRLADQAAWAKNGADDGANHNAGDDRGRGRGKDDGANHR